MGSGERRRGMGRVDLVGRGRSTWVVGVDVRHGWTACIHLDACIMLDIHGEDMMIYIQRVTRLQLGVTTYCHILLITQFSHINHHPPDREPTPSTHRSVRFIFPLGRPLRDDDWMSLRPLDASQSLPLLPSLHLSPLDIPLILSLL
jgi:hypothetical protein